MALLDFIKKKEKGMPKKQSEEAAKKKAESEVRGANKKDLKKTELKSSGSAFQVLKEPHITEKSTDLTKFNQYVFRVFKNANKTEIKKSIEEMYGVHVVGISKVKIPRKQRRRGRQQGWKSGYVKAIVRLKEGERIEVLPH